MSNLVSVVMPLYNHVKYVSSAIESILSQTHSELELIIVDDGSTDGSSDIAKRYSNDKRVTYIYKDNGGTGSALNLGFKLAIGNYGTWVSSDNIYYSDMLTTFINFLQDPENNSEFVFSAFDMYDGDVFSSTSDTFGVVRPQIVTNFIDISYDACITGMCYLFTIHLKNKCGDYMSVPGEDYHMGVMMGLNTNVGFIPRALGKYRRHSNSVSGRLLIDSSGHIGKEGISAAAKVKQTINEWRKNGTTRI